MITLARKYSANVRKTRLTVMHSNCHARRYPPRQDQQAGAHPSRHIVRIPRFEQTPKPKAACNRAPREIRGAKESRGAGSALAQIIIHTVVSAGRMNPLIGSAGVSAVPMAARVSQKVGSEADPTNFLLMHAMGPNVAGVIGTAVAAGAFMAIFGA